MLDIAQRHFYRRGGIEISYLQWNSSVESFSNPKKNLLLLHGLADLAMVWSSLGEYLKEDYQIVAPDLRGHGESSKPNNGYSSQEIIADLEGLMNHLGWSEAHILGHSWGGKLAAIWATSNPKCFSSLILVAPFYLFVREDPH